MSAKSVVSALTGFLSHHVNDLSAIHSALSELVSIAPIDGQDKERVNTVLETVENSVRNISDFLAGTHVTEGNVTIKESDIVNAIGDFLKTDEGRKAFIDAVKSAEGNSNG